MQVPNFDKDGNLVTVEVKLEQYKDIKLSAFESDQAVRKYKRQLFTDHLTTDQMKEALRRGREKKHFDHKTANYFRKAFKKY